MRRMYPDILLVALDCEQWEFGWVLTCIGSGVNRVGLLSPLVLISITSCTIGNRIYLSGSH